MKKWILLFLLPLKIIFSQDITGGLNGQILDSLNKPIEGVEIIVSGTSLQGTRGTTADSRGYFILSKLPSGIYKIDINSVNYQNLTYENFPVQLGTTSSLGIINLKSRIINIPEVIIYDKNTAIDPTTTTVGGNLSFKTFDALPINRNFRSMISLLPQVNESYLGDQANVSGSTGPENIYYIDGLNVTNIVNANLSTDLPYNFVKEVQVKSGGYEAEYGHALGGIVNVITKSGSNEFHGGVFSYFTSNILEGRPSAITQIVTVPNYQLYDLGFNLGGPIILNKLWFFVAYNPNVDLKNVELPVFGKYTDRNITHLFAAKLNWNSSQNTNFTFSLFGDPFSHNSINTDYINNGWTVINKDVLFAKTNGGDIDLSVHGWHNFNNNLLLETSVSYLRRFVNSYPNGAFAPTFQDDITRTVSGGIGEIGKQLETRSNISSSISDIIGGHSLKLGVQFEDNSYNVSTQENSLGSFIERPEDSFYIVHYFNGNGGTVRNHVLSAYIQDSWQISDRLTVNPGFRWEAQFMISSLGKLWQTIPDEYQPRIGIIYQPGKISTQKIFASYGRFYEEIPLVLATHYGAENPTILKYYSHNPLIDPLGEDSTGSYFDTILPKVPNFKGEYIDEYLLGYERVLFKFFKLTLKGTYRYLPQTVEDGFDFNLNHFIIGNPGTPSLSFFPKLYRIYKSLEVTLESLNYENYYFMISYVLSRNYGNYSGLFEDGAVQPNTSSLPDVPFHIPNNTGLLPNDRTHVFKFSGSYSLGFGLTIGTSFLWETGTPLTEFGQDYFGQDYFVSPRGTAGRTPALWDLNFRFTYDFGNIFNSSFNPRLKLDLFHVFSQRTPVNYDQVHYMNLDENEKPINPNPNYLTPIAYQLPFTARLGLEVNF